jgi:hypothetical protein
MTEPYGWEYLRAVGLGGEAAERERADFSIEFIKDYMEPYGFSEFGETEWKLSLRANAIMEKNRTGTPELGDIKE